MNDRPCIASMPLAAYDVETTGADPQTARIVQAAVVIDVPGSDNIIWSWIVNPECEIPLEATAVHGISTENAQTNGISITDAIGNILDAFKVAKTDYGVQALCAFNSVFDLTILDREMGRNSLGGLSMEHYVRLPIIDPMICDRKMDPYRRGRRTLTAVSSAYKVVVSQAHQAHGDCLTTIKLARAMARKYPRFNYANLDKLQQLQRDAHREFAEHFQSYRRQETPDFTCSGDWPILSDGQ